jgi:hypothetical protein
MKKVLHKHKQEPNCIIDDWNVLLLRVEIRILTQYILICTVKLSSDMFNSHVERTGEPEFIINMIS